MARDVQIQTITTESSGVEYLSVLSLQDVRDAAPFLGTAFPVIALAYYAGAREQLDDLIGEHEATDDATRPSNEASVGWQVTIPVPESFRAGMRRSALKGLGNTYSTDGKGLQITETFRLGADRVFLLMFPCCFLLSLLIYVEPVLWLLALCIVFLGGLTCAFLFFATQVSAIKIAARASLPNRRYRLLFMSVQQRDVPFWLLFRAFFACVAIMIAAIGIGVLVALSTSPI
jgi:hypothetical protein